MQNAPTLLLAIAYWLHMLATVVWLGGLAALGLLIIPAARKTLPDDSYASLLGAIQPKLQNIAWLSLAVLIVTGMFQMSANPNYEGLLAFGNSWAMAILAKHIVVLLMIAASAWNTWGVLPALRRLALLRAAGREVDPAQSARLARREQTLLTLNLVLSALVLALTALARAV